jgi:hypothetical protein
MRKVRIGFQYSPDRSDTKYSGWQEYRD